MKHALSLIKRMENLRTLSRAEVVNRVIKGRIALECLSTGTGNATMLGQLYATLCIGMRLAELREGKVPPALKKAYDEAVRLMDMTVAMERVVTITETTVFNVHRGLVLAEEAFTKASPLQIEQVTTNIMIERAKQKAERPKKAA
ncbi:hypothetical protein [Chitinibacter tainanensis]|uniref:hypothetical protein n=1 Tax=Chitinibacter tainanensis TaxID=230667 RepID=UPI00048EBC4B|nr:hypothetical protein [Chitinibacter tainanensis]